MVKSKMVTLIQNHDSFFTSLSLAPPSLTDLPPFHHFLLYVKRLLFFPCSSLSHLPLHQLLHCVGLIQKFFSAFSVLEKKTKIILQAFVISLTFHFILLFQSWIISPFHDPTIVEWFGLEETLETTWFQTPYHGAGMPLTRSGSSQPLPGWPQTLPGMG